jgi:formylglycine-generating enzyme required for sulfatase activity
MPLIYKRKIHTAQFFPQRISSTVSLDMVLIPGGSFLMGAPEDDLERRDNEGPQHLVTVPSFCMGKYPVTQAQWRFVADFPQVNQKLDPDPADFKGDDRPVENISREDSVEFCERLNQLTGRDYRLPSEAEWEYACRAGTTTPFHFGETIATDLANYGGTDDPDNNRSGSYGRGPKGIDRSETTPVGTFLPNAFGLYDMHGNVWEWCLDHLHSNYEGAPTDGSAWLSDEKGAHCPLRGGSWYDSPRYCRSAVRGYSTPGGRNDNIGFRVVCSANKILQVTVNSVEPKDRTNITQS